MPFRRGRPRRPDMVGVSRIRPLYSLSELSLRPGVTNNSDNRNNDHHKSANLVPFLSLPKKLVIPGRSSLTVAEWH